MPSFNDIEGVEWPVVVKTPVAKKCRDEIQVNLFAPDAFEVLQADPILLLQTLWILCRQQAGDLKLDRQAFEDRIEGDPLEDALIAVLEATANFRGGSMKTALLGVADQLRQMKTLDLDELVKKQEEAEKIRSESGS